MNQQNIEETYKTARSFTSYDELYKWAEKKDLLINAYINDCLLRLSEQQRHYEQQFINEATNNPDGLMSWLNGLTTEQNEDEWMKEFFDVPEDNDAVRTWIESLDDEDDEFFNLPKRQRLEVRIFFIF